MRLFLMVLVCACTGLAAPRAQAVDGLKVVVIDGDEAANIVKEKIAAEPVIEVRDRENRRVANAIVRFTIRKTARNRLAAVFRNGQSEVRTLTDAAGRASTNVITPLEPGSFQIDVEASYEGQAAKATIHHTNYATTADAQAAGRQPAQSGGQAAGAAAAGSTAGATAGTASGAGSAAAAGGGMSKAAVIALTVGGAAGAGAAVVLSRKESSPPTGSVGVVAGSGTNGLQSSTVFTFSVRPTGFEATTTSYRWEFGDGQNSAEAAPQHVYDAPGSYTVSVTVRDARQSARSETVVQVQSAQGTWFNGALGPGTTLQLTQSGSSIAGVETSGGYVCPLTGSGRSGTPQMVLTVPQCPQPPFGPLVAHEYRFNLLPDGRLSGEGDYGSRLLIVVFVRQ